MENQERFMNQVAHCTESQKRLLLALMNLMLALRDAPQYMKDCTLEAVDKIVNSEEPPDLSVWAAAIENWK
jgi:hypothetical protein